MKQLTVGDILNVVKQLKDSGMKQSEIKKLPVYLGDDDELNGIHCGWYAQMIDSNSELEDDQLFVEMINENRTNIKLNGKAILLS